jgi:hypothetical protein
MRAGQHLPPQRRDPNPSTGGLMRLALQTLALAAALAAAAPASLVSAHHDEDERNHAKPQVVVISSTARW